MNAVCARPLEGRSLEGAFGTAGTRAGRPAPPDAPHPAPPASRPRPTAIARPILRRVVMVRASRVLPEKSGSAPCSRLFRVPSFPSPLSSDDLPRRRSVSFSSPSRITAPRVPTQTRWRWSIPSLRWSSSSAASSSRRSRARRRRRGARWSEAISRRSSLERSCEPPRRSTPSARDSTTPSPRAWRTPCAPPRRRTTARGDARKRSRVQRRRRRAPNRRRRRRRRPAVGDHRVRAPVRRPHRSERTRGGAHGSSERLSSAAERGTRRRARASGAPDPHRARRQTGTSITSPGLRARDHQGEKKLVDPGVRAIERRTAAAAEAAAEAAAAAAAAAAEPDGVPGGR